MKRRLVSLAIACGIALAGVGVAAAPAGADSAPGYNRNAAVAWATANAQDSQGSGALCTWFVSQALWAGGLPQTSDWQQNDQDQGTHDATYVDGLVNYLVSNGLATWTDITGDMSPDVNVVPEAEPGDIIVYDWNDGGTQFDHMSFVVDTVSGGYPEVAEWGQFDFNPWDYVDNPSSPYVTRGWTYSVMHNEWLQTEHPGMLAHLLHINNGYYVGTF
jgi:hypothetical protein